ncbi:C39 family peptidase [Pectobacterium sp. IFB5596]|uniref:C39 family peptidase n=1 Tax=Pectobacterium sp. IFB5596 TaxID=1839803 RepID=UPI001F1F855B|nr:cysteine peptidase family C39 domain-containing protein [Pectobacterium sp. IFB5596]MCE9730889.1 hypothetical protein [Pectobacterium sp. IFB5596]
MKSLLCIFIMLIMNYSYAYNTSIKGWVNLRMDGINRQTTDFSCGPAALSLLLNMKFGIDIKEIEIISDIIFRSDSGAERSKIESGFSLLDLKQQVERLGYPAKGVKFEIDNELVISEPIIIPIEGPEYIHFVVLDRMNKENATLYDPEIGKINMPIYELKHRWKGYALLIGG